MATRFTMQLVVKPAVRFTLQAVSRLVLSRPSLALSLAQGRPVFTADHYFSDPNTGKVVGFIDWNDPTRVAVFKP